MQKLIKINERKKRKIFKKYSKQKLGNRLTTIIEHQNNRRDYRNRTRNRRTGKQHINRKI